MAFKTGPNMGLKYGANRGEDWESQGNENFLRLDAFLGLKLLGMDVNTPPGSPLVGDAYTVGPAPTGAWAGQAGKVALFVESAWRFETPRASITALNVGEFPPGFYVYSDHETQPAWYLIATI
jgi:hypothetical protein